MCGIAGALVLNNNRFEIDDAYINRMLDTMPHRGPDGSGIWVSAERQMGLGHRRLSIIDLPEKAAQPMSNADNTIWISFNEEIYSFRPQVCRTGDEHSISLKSKRWYKK